MRDELREPFTTFSIVEGGKLLNKGLTFLMAAAILVTLAAAQSDEQRSWIQNGQGEMSGEVTDRTVILQSRLTQGGKLVDGDLPGASGIGRFEISTEKDFQNARSTEWINATADDDYIIKTKVAGLRPGTCYYYRLRYGVDKQSTRLGRTCSFKTLDGPKKSSPVRFVVVTGMNYAFFHYGTDGRGRGMYSGPDKHLGYPALATMLEMKPDFFVGTGDNVYYDHPRATRARTQKELRRKWHEQFVQPRFIELFRQVPTYWQKDDHDHRFNDSDPHTPYGTPKNPKNHALAQQPSNELGIRTFWEQVPVVDPRQKEPVTYRTHRVSLDLQIWLVEGRDYRSPNKMPNGPGKTLWGKQQIAWLQRTLLKSDATFKILISPTPLVGPAIGGKRDSHANLHGFRHEADEFFAWLDKHGFLDKNFYLVNGDRHWQYHAVHPNGFEEFSCGAICDANATPVIVPGQPGSTDPQGKITHKYSQSEPSGGFLMISITPAGRSLPAQAEFSFFDERGKLNYREVETAKQP